MSLLHALFSAINVTGPILLILALGIWFKHANFINDQFVIVANRLVFNISLPSLLFISIANKSLADSLNLKLVMFGAIMTLIIVAALWLIAPIITDKDKRGVFAQCAFRGNMGIIGLALCINAYGDAGLVSASVYISFMVILYNILSVVLLNAGDVRSQLQSILKNPLIIGVVLGILWSLSGVQVPFLISRSAEYFAHLTIPLALLAIGGTLNWHSARSNQRDVIWITAFKLIIIPMITVPAALLMGFRGTDLGILFMMMATPSATASYIMARAMTPYGALAAESVALTTALCPFAITLGLVLLQTLQLT
ncbi:AEC family transporter [Gynuella sp.]|uniref:AEC family transporter n=1 Tax=Gynuella sp. TaxID=2969146 RepID=UPI003D0A0287